MSLFAVTPSPPTQIPEASKAKAPDVNPDPHTADANAPKPVVLAPLPPGQGTRIDQLVCPALKPAATPISVIDPLIVWCLAVAEAYTAHDGCPGNGYGPMPEAKTYTGGCHCGMVRF